ncbi:dihydrodipicolinate synthase family protein [Thalassobaculum salexigens]|uniref:dihydrodipicolinate synthase family protein n=1 Tax=Thalassobaculum salexigens TaxID=455360 RepID=UPI00248F01B2|nr:dihydrodipicolinate synthase family protein [Thalassobaculum salexigens]
MADPQGQGPFRGIYPMLYALFAADGSLDRGANDAQVEACIAGGVHGLAVGGLASECNKLTVEERRDHARWTLEAAAKAASDRVPVSVTVSDNTVGGQIESVKRAAEAGAAWAVLQPPPVKSASEEELIRFFGAVADASPIPIGIQNAPEYIGIGLSNAGLIELNRRHPTISILKAEGTGLYIGRLAEESGGAFTLFNGRNGIELLDSLRHGCAGLIPGVEACDVESRIYDLHMAGRADDADRAFREILPLLHFLMHTIDHLLCYGKRLAARRIGLSEVHDRGPAQAPHPVGMAILDHWSRDLGRLGQ